MSDSVAQTANLKSRVPTFLPLADAAREFGLSKKTLTQMIQTGELEAVQLPSGELLVSAESNGHEPKTKQEIIAVNFAHLRRQHITVTKAAEKYSLNRDTILEWVKRKYITALKPGYRMELDEAEVAYCAKIYQDKLEEYGQLQGVPIFDEEGNPYRVMHPELSRQRRQRKE